MKFTCTKENFLKGLHSVTGVTIKPGNLPILSHVLIQVTESGVELVSTNLEIAITAHVRAKVEEPGSFTVPAKTFLDYVNLLREEQVHISQEKNELLIASGQAATKIKGVSGEEFPVVPEVEKTTQYVFETERLRHALSQVGFASSKTDIRPELSGIYFQFGAKPKTLTMAATDSYRLAERHVEIKSGDTEMQCIVPSKTVAECIRLLQLAGGKKEGDTVTMWVTPNQISLTHPSFTITSRLIDGSYPDYTQIIPSEFKTTAIVPVEMLSTTIKAASLFTATGVDAVSCTFDPQAGALHISSGSAQTGEHSAPIDSVVSGEENNVLLNHRYLLDGLNQMHDSEVTFQLNGPDAPCIVKNKTSDEYLYIVMPIRQ